MRHSLDLFHLPGAWVALTALGAALVTGALGYGFSSITVPVALLFFPNRVLAPALVIVELFTNLLGLFTHRKHVPAVARRMSWIVLGLLPGVALGAWVLSTAGAHHLKLATYAVLLPLVVIQTTGRRWPLHQERTASVPTGLAIGALYSATTISGPPLALFLNNQGLVLAEFRAAVYLIRVAESVSTTLLYFVLGLFSPASRELAMQLAPSVIVGLPVGMFLLRRLEPEAFRRICMGANACFIAYGLARSLLEMNLAPAALAYGLTLAVAIGQLFLVIRFISLRRRDAMLAAPRAN